MEKEKQKNKNILFLCTGNSCRSQMAEGWGKFLFGSIADFYSAGTKPSVVDSYAIKVMKEVNVDISQHRSKSVDEFIQKSFDYVVTVCDSANEACPIFPGLGKRIHRSFEDPSRLTKESKTEEETLNHYRRVRDDIYEFVKNLPKEWNL